MRVIGIMLLHNEDRFVEVAVRNIIEFCDELIIVDHDSDDFTPATLKHLSEEFAPKIRIIPTHDTRDSHRVVKTYAGSDTWAFGVDGDEVYDPEGLLRFRARLEAGEFDKWWVVFGNVLNVKSLDASMKSATGHLAPPSRSMTKLYNFSAIESWDGDCVERLHGGEIVFKKNFDASLRCSLHESVDWDHADFRCLHLCFLKRSSKDSAHPAPRQNIMDRHAWSFEKLIRRAKEKFLGAKPIDWKYQKYARGPLVSKPVGAFFPARPEAP